MCALTPSVHFWEAELRWQLRLYTWLPRAQVNVWINLFPDGLAKTKLIFSLKKHLQENQEEEKGGLFGMNADAFTWDTFLTSLKASHRMAWLA